MPLPMMSRLSFVEIIVLMHQNKSEQIADRKVLKLPKITVANEPDFLKKFLI